MSNPRNQIWDEGDDENLGLLIDSAIQCVKDMEMWTKERFIECLFEDGVLNDHDVKWTLHDAILMIYAEAGGNAFFDNWINLNYEFEVKMWRDKMQRRSNLRSTYEDIMLNTNVTVYMNDGQMNFQELVHSFNRLGHFVDPGVLKQIFNEIACTKNGVITSREYRSWSQKLKQQKNKKSSVWNVYYNQYKHRYELVKGKGRSTSFRRQHLIQINELDCNHHSAKWAVFDELDEEDTKELNFDQLENADDVPKGYWRILSKDDDKIVPVLHLTLIHQLLNHYYSLNFSAKLQAKHKDDDTPLRTGHKILSYGPINTDDEYEYDDTSFQMKVGEDEKQIAAIHKYRKVKEHDIRFYIEGNDRNSEYQLTWWNENGQYETNAIALINITSIYNSIS